MINCIIFQYTNTNLAISIKYPTQDIWAHRHAVFIFACSFSAFLLHVKIIHAHVHKQCTKIQIIKYDKSMKVGGLQCIITNDEYVMPINFINGLPYLPKQPYTDEEIIKLPQILLTADSKWNPQVLDNTIDNIDEWAAKFDNILSTNHEKKDSPR